MAVENEGKDGPSGKGFAGLSSMVSNVDAAVANAEKAGRAVADASGVLTQGNATLQTQPADAPQPRPEAYQEPSSQRSSSGMSSAGKWLLGIGAVIGSIWLLSESGNKSTAPSPTYTPSPQPPVTSPSVPSWQPPPAAPRPQIPSRPSEEKPPVGTDLVLSVPQIRYCVAEHIRLDAAKGAINNSIELDVERFNAMVADYNSRCGRFRYRRGDLEGARVDIEAIRSLIEAEGRRRFTTDTRSDTRGAQTQASHSPPSSIVQQVQELLNKLGYDAGVANGIAGQKTAAAIVAFQRDQGLEVDGEPSTWLLTALIRKNRATQQNPSSDTSRERVGSVNRPSIHDLSGLTSTERQSIESACASDKMFNGPAAYNACLSKKLRALEHQGPPPDLSGLGSAERSSIESACASDRMFNGPAAYYACLSRRIAEDGK